MSTPLFEVVDGAVVLRVHVSPGASRTAVVGRHGDALKVAVAAPAEGGRANEAVATVLAEHFGLARRAVVLVRGRTSRAKSFRLDGAAPDQVAATLRTVLEGVTRR